MGLDIGIVHELKWPPRPGWALWEELSNYVVDADGTYMSLTNVREALSEMMLKDGVVDLDSEQGREFVEWCEEYWKQRGLGGNDSISIVLDY